MYSAHYIGRVTSSLEVTTQPMCEETTPPMSDETAENYPQEGTATERSQQEGSARRN